MKEEILKRAMFAMPLSKEAQGTGIMSGFDMDEMEEMDQDVDENADMEEMPPMARTPQNPEILMNTLRGDMRSLDARYMELAQMVGEEAAMETPPEVLAMLMGQMGAQQSGIGALPQGQDMMPPGAAGMPPPDQMGAPQPAPAMPQGGIPMPSGMESAPPFSPGAEAPQQFNKGGAAKRRGDDAQLLEGGGGGGGGGFTSPTFSAPVRPPAFEVTPTGQAALAKPPSMSVRDYLSDKAGKVSDFMGGFPRPAQFETRIIADLNKGLGSRFMAPQPSVSRLTGGSPPISLTRQQQEALIQNPTTGVISQGTGTRLAPYTTMGPLTSPTLSQGFTQGMNRLVAEYPRVAALLPPSILAAVGIVGPTLTEEQRSTPLTALEQAKYDETMRQIDAVNQPTVNQRIMDPRDSSAARKTDIIPPALAVADKEEEVIPSGDPLGTFITEKLAGFDKREEILGNTLAKDKRSKIDRIRESQAEYAPLFEELLGSDKESAKINALLLLSEAGLKLASTSKPTFAMALADASSGLPRGFAAIAAQERELGMKVKGASLQQAISDVDAQDKYAQAFQLQDLKGQWAVKKTIAERDLKLLDERPITEDGGMGLRNIKTKNGSYVGSGIDPNDPAVKSAVQSRFTLRDTDNPFVENRGQAPTTIETDKAERIKLGNTLRSLDNSLSTLDNLKGVYTSAYGPGAWFSDKVNNLLVPIDPTGLVKPNFDTADAATRISTGMNTLLKSIASANDSGRVAVQEQEWVRETAKGISNPTAFFADKELAAKQFGSTEAMLRNARQQTLTQLGYEGNDYVMRTPNTGTKNDPFIIPSDPAERKIMYNFLGSTIGRLQDPRATVYLRDPNGTVKPFTPPALLQMNRTE